MRLADCPFCHARNVRLALCADCETREVCAYCDLGEPGEGVICPTCRKARDRAAAPPACGEVDNCGECDRCVDEVRCDVSSEPVERCGHLDADEDVELGGEGGFA